MSKHSPLPDPADQVTIRRVMGFAQLSGKRLPGSQLHNRVTFDLDQALEMIEPVFLGSHSPADPVDVMEGQTVVARLTMEALGAQVLKSRPPGQTRRAILEWAGRIDIYWCEKGAHFTDTWPCPEHGD